MPRLCTNCRIESLDFECETCGQVLAVRYVDDEDDSASHVSATYNPLTRSRNEFEHRLRALQGEAPLPVTINLDRVRRAVNERGGVDAFSTSLRLADVVKWRALFKQLGYQNTYWAIPTVYAQLYGRQPRLLTFEEAQRYADDYIDLITRLQAHRRSGSWSRQRHLMMALRWLIHRRGREEVVLRQDLLSLIPHALPKTERAAYAAFDRAMV